MGKTVEAKDDMKFLEGFGASCLCLNAGHRKCSLNRGTVERGDIENSSAKSPSTQPEYKKGLRWYRRKRDAKRIDGVRRNGRIWLNNLNKSNRIL